jgi:hypothetical protein
MMRQDQRGALSALHVTGVSLLHDVKIAAAQGERRKLFALRSLDAHIPVAHHGLVEPDGIEPTTSCLQSRRSPN